MPGSVHSNLWVDAVSDIFQSNAKMLAVFAEAPGLSIEAQVFHAEIEAEALPYASVDWIVKFPSIVDGV